MNILVVGGSTGIGGEVVDLALSKNHQIWMISRKPNDLLSGKVNYIQADIKTANLSTFESLPEQIDGIVYCPGSINLKPFTRFTEDEMLEDYKLNVTSALKTVQLLLPNLKKSANASIVFFSTVAVQMGMSFHTQVACSKGAIEGLTRSLAAELAPQIRVNAIAPSLTDTPLASRLLADDAKRTNSAQRHPLERIGTPNDIANAVMFLLSDESSWMTGQILHIDGGMSSIK